MIPAAALALSLLALQDTAPSAAITLTDDAVSMPATITAAGPLLLTIANTGTGPHDLRFVRLSAGHTLDQFKAWKESGKPIPEWLVSAGGVAAIGAGSTAEYIASFAAGSYVVLSDNRVFQALQVSAGRGGGVKPPDSDLTVTLHDHGFQLTAPVPSGRPFFHVVNTGSEPHQMLLVRLPEGSNEFRQRAWISAGSQGESPGEQSGGILELAPGAQAWFRTALKPGRYVMLCGELEEEGRHFDLGMVYRFEIE
jgi:hypothetical protein